MKAAKEGEIKMVKLLLDSGADVKAKNKKGKTALDIARAKGNMEIVKLITEAMGK